MRNGTVVFVAEWFDARLHKVKFGKMSPIVRAWSVVRRINRAFFDA